MVTRIRVSINGTLGATAQERWSVGLNFATDSALSPTEAQTAAVSVAAGFVTRGAISLGDLSTLMSVRAAITDVDVYGYGPAGPATGVGHANLSAAIAGSGTATSPPQCAAVISLLTALNGPSYRGRVYWPALNPTVSGDLVSNVAKSAGPEFLAMVAGVQGNLLDVAPTEWGVYSPKLDVITPVTTIRCGDVIDTQRRRRDTLTESFTLTGVPG